MSHLDRQIRRVQRRLWLNRWMNAFFSCLAIGAGLFAAVVLVQRLYDLNWPLFWVGVGLGGAALLSSLVWMWVTREDVHVAATTLDEAAGLRERLSSAQYCRDSDDPFARAVVADAEQVSSALSVRRHIRLRFPQPLPWASFALVAAALMFLITPGVLKQTEASEESNQSELTKQVKAVVKKKLQEIQRLADEYPALADLKDDLRDLDKQSGGMLKRPGDIRHEAVKKIDRLADAVKKKQGDLKYKANQELRRMFRRLQAPKSGSEATKKLSKKLQQGDFKGAKEELQKLQEQLATLKSDEDKEFAKKMGEQLAKLAKQLEELSIDKKLAQKLAQAGLKKEDVERMLETLGKKDIEQIKKALEKQGMSQKQINKMIQKLQQQQLGAAQAQQMGKSLQKAAAACKSGQPGEAAAGLAMAAGQLSDAEALEAEMAQIEATLAELRSARNSLDGACSQCKGTGRSGGKPCGRCQGNGNRPGPGGMGKLGKGRGGLAPEQQAGMGFKTERAKVHTGKGAIIGQFLVDGEQVKGDVQSALSEVVAAAEHDASDRIGRNRIPRQYQKAVKEYFSSVQRLVKDKNASEGPSNPSKGDPVGDE